MSDLNQLHQKIHQLAQEKAKKHGLELEIEIDYWYVLPKNNPKNEWQLVHRDNTNPNKYNDFAPAIQEPQIRHILTVLEGVLGGNPEFSKWFYRQNFTKQKTNTQNYEGERYATINLLPQSQSEALYNRWFPFKNRPSEEQVLTELLEVLKLI